MLYCAASHYFCSWKICDTKDIFPPQNIIMIMFKCNMSVFMVSHSSTAASSHERSIDESTSENFNNIINQTLQWLSLFAKLTGKVM